ncbi:MAG: hypothetical protein ACRYFU_03935 [Janthinobacterium lividum]
MSALVMPAAASAQQATWQGISPHLIERKPSFTFTAPEYCAQALVDFIRDALLHLTQPAA